MRQDVRSEKRLLWRRIDRPGMEHCEVRWDASGGAASGITVGTADGAGFGARWEVRFDADWITRQVMVIVGDQILDLSHQGEGAWYEDSQPRDDLVGLWDVDIGCTPFTNTLAIRRLALAVGQPADINVCFVSVPDLTATVAKQRYTRLAPARYRFAALFRDFETDLWVDEDGLVQSYERMFERIDAL
jgi:hypothetical protein